MRIRARCYPIVQIDTEVKNAIWFEIIENQNFSNFSHSVKNIMLCIINLH